jgi:ribosomal protein S18 acetylase RimI-like enzyme
MVADGAVPQINKIDADTFTQFLPQLTALLIACVDAGAGVHFLKPVQQADANAYWQVLLPRIRSGALPAFFATQNSQLLGCVFLILDTPQNGPHRCEVTKLLVHPAARRRGIGKMLMQALETEARAHARKLIVLDTATGDSAERLYAALGFQAAGIIPNYWLDAERELQPTTVMFKQL